MPSRRSRPTATTTENPFVIGHPAEGVGFADRVDEVARVAQALQDPTSRLVVYGDRRLGKSSAIGIAAARARAAKHPVAIADLGRASSATAAAQRVLTAVHREIGVSVEELVRQTAAQLRGAVTVTATADPGGGTTFGLRLEPGALPETRTRLVTEILDVVEARCASRRQKIGLVLDEFQRLLLWGGEDVEWALKATFESHRHIAYVMAGSSRTLIADMVSKKRRALWGVVDSIEIGPIDPPLLVGWIVERAQATGVTLDPITAAAIVRLAGPRTRDIVQLARAVWFRVQRRGHADRQDVIDAMEALVAEQAPLHLRVWAGRTMTEQKVLLALVASPTAPPLAAETLLTHDLGPKSTAQSALQTLVADEVLTPPTASSSYGFDDPIFRRWVERYVLEDLGRGAPPLLADDAAEESER